MSIIVSKRVWKSSKAKGNTLLVLLALADHANEKDYCWPGVQRISRWSRLSPRTVQRCLRELQKMGEIVVDQERGPACNGGHTNGYHVMVGVDTSEDSDTQGGDDSGPGSVTKLTPPPVTMLSPKPSVEPSKEIISIIPDSSSSLVDSGAAPLELPEKRHNPPVPPPPLHDRCEEFCRAVVKLRELHTGYSIPSLNKHQRQKIEKGLESLGVDFGLKRLLWLYAAAWSHWDSVRDAFEKGHYVEGFHAKLFWPPEQGLTHVNRVEEFLYREAKKNKEWHQSLLANVKESMSHASTLAPEAPK